MDNVIHHYSKNGNITSHSSKKKKLLTYSFANFEMTRLGPGKAYVYTRQYSPDFFFKFKLNKLGVSFFEEGTCNSNETLMVYVKNRDERGRPVLAWPNSIIMHSNGFWNLNRNATSSMGNFMTIIPVGKRKKNHNPCCKNIRECPPRLIVLIES